MATEWIYASTLSFKEKILLLFCKTYKVKSSHYKYETIVKYKILKGKKYIVSEKTIEIR